MKVTRSYNFVFSREEVNAIHRMWEFISDLEDYEYSELLKQAAVTDFFDDLDNLLIFAEDRME